MTAKPKVLTSTTTYRDHNFAYGTVQKQGQFFGWIMIRITGGPACPPGSGRKDFFGRTETEAKMKAKNFVDDGLRKSSSRLPLTGEASRLGATSSTSMSSTSSRSMSQSISNSATSSSRTNTESADAKDCPVCLESISSGSSVVVSVVPCGHCFCNSCAKKMVRNFATPPSDFRCPKCRCKPAMLMKLHM